MGDDGHDDVPASVQPLDQIEDQRRLFCPIAAVGSSRRSTFAFWKKERAIVLSLAAPLRVLSWLSTIRPHYRPPQSLPVVLDALFCGLRGRRSSIPPVGNEREFMLRPCALNHTRKISKEERRIGVDPPPPKASPNAKFEVRQTITEKGAPRVESKRQSCAILRSRDRKTAILADRKRASRAPSPPAQARSSAPSSAPWVTSYMV